MQLGATHPDVATTMANTAGLLKAMSKFAEAETVYRTVRPHSDLTCTLLTLCAIDFTSLCLFHCSPN